MSGPVLGRAGDTAATTTGLPPSPGGPSPAEYIDPSPDTDDAERAGLGEGAVGAPGAPETLPEEGGFAAESWGMRRGNGQRGGEIAWR